MYTRHAHNRRSRNRLLRGRAPRRGGSSLTLRQQIGAQLGSTVNVFADARELTVGDGNAVATWGDWTMTGDPTLDADAWRSSLPMVSLVTAGDTPTYYGRADAEAANYAAETPFIWCVTLHQQNAGTYQTFICLGDSDDAAQHWFANRLHVDGVAYSQIRNNAGTVDIDSGSLLTIGEPAHYAYMYTGSAVYMLELTQSNGLRTIMDNEPKSITGFSVDELLLGVRQNGGTLQFQANILVGLTSLTRCSAGAATPANLQAVINLHNQAYPVA